LVGREEERLYPWFVTSVYTQWEHLSTKNTGRIKDNGGVG